MSQGFNPRRYKVDSDEAERWATFRSTAEEGHLPDHPDVLLLLIDALRTRIRSMDRTKHRNLAEIKIPSKTDIDGLQGVAEELLIRVESLDRTTKKQLAARIRIYILHMTQRCRWPGEVELNWLYAPGVGHYDLLFESELQAISSSKLVSFTCLPAVLSLQQHLLGEYMRWRAPDGYADDDTPETWIKRNHKRVFEALTLYKCSCTYLPDLNELSKMVVSGPIPPKKRNKDTRTFWSKRPSSWILDDWPFPPVVEIFKDTKDLSSGIIEAMSVRGPGEMIPALLSALHGSSVSTIRQILKPSARQSKVPSFLQKKPPLS